MSKKVFAKSSGYTLVEIMVVVVILVIVGAVGLSIYSSFTVKSRWSEVQPCLSKTAINLENYRQNHGAYPSSDIFNKIGGSSECGEYYEGQVTVFNSGQNYVIAFVDSKKSISGKSTNDVWAMTDVSNKVLHTQNPIDPTDVDVPPSGYGPYIPN